MPRRHSEADMVLKDGTIVTPQGMFRAGIVVRDGKTAAITSSSELPTASKVIDCKGLYILPGIVDAHVHFMDPGQTRREDFTTGSTAAATGGITLVMDMPMTSPAVTNTTIFEEKRRMAESKSLIDFCLLAMATNSNASELNKLQEAGAAATEVFPANFWPSTTLREDLILASDYAVMKTLRQIGQTRGIAGVLPDMDELRIRLIQELMDSGRKDLQAWSESKPEYYEVSALAKLLGLLHYMDTKAVLRQLTSAGSIEVLMAFYREGIFTEVDVQNLTLTEDRLKEIGPYAKTNPPLRTKRDVTALWEALQMGWIDYVASDHGPCTPEDKERGWKNVWESPSGMLGVETLLPLMLNSVNNRKIPLEHLTALLSENPARIHGIYPKKGAIRPGSDADFTLVDMRKKEVIRGEKLHSRLKWTPYEGFEVKGWPTHTIVRGQLIVEKGETVGRTGYGQFVPSYPK